MNRKLLIIPGVLCVAAAVFFGIRAGNSLYAPKEVQTLTLRPAPAEEQVAAEAVTTRMGPVTTAATQPSTPTAQPEQQDEPEAEPEPYVSPVDFAALQAINTDIYAWLEIPGTLISYPLVQDPENDAFYMNHDSDRNWSANGALFSEATYNTPDIVADPVTIVYGHHMLSGAMFGNLEQYYSDSAFLEEHPTFTVYTPDGEYTYGVFAAVPYPAEHILKNHDFEDEADYTAFVETVFAVRDLRARFR